MDVNHRWRGSEQTGSRRNPLCQGTHNSGKTTAVIEWADVNSTMTTAPVSRSRCCRAVLPQTRVVFRNGESLASSCVYDERRCDVGCWCSRLLEGTCLCGASSSSLAVARHVATMRDRERQALQRSVQGCLPCLTC